MTAETRFEPSTVNVISALWTAMLFVFAYVDLFSLYRPDFRADLEAGEIGEFTVNQTFLLGTTIYVVIPSRRSTTPGSRGLRAPAPGARRTPRHRPQQAAAERALR